MGIRDVGLFLTHGWASESQRKVQLVPGRTNYEAQLITFLFSQQKQRDGFLPELMPLPAHSFVQPAVIRDWMQDLASEGLSAWAPFAKYSS